MFLLILTTLNDINNAYSMILKQMMCLDNKACFEMKSVRCVYKTTAKWQVSKEITTCLWS